MIDPYFDTWVNTCPWCNEQGVIEDMRYDEENKDWVDIFHCPKCGKWWKCST